MVKYPYRDLSLKNLKGEKWEDIPGFDGFYQVSNYGRIKRLPYEMPYKNGVIYLKPEKIIKPTIIRQPNKFKKDYTYFLVNRVIFNKKRYNFTIARLVYYCFVTPFKLEDHHVVVLCKDSNNFNIKPSNLAIATISEKQQRTIKKKRFRSPFFDLSEKVREKQRKAIIKSKSKRISQYGLNGKKLKTYPSAAAAQRATGIYATSIGNRASGNGRTAGGYIWRWGDKSKIAVFKQSR
jgi:hypothetical protein